MQACVLPALPPSPHPPPRPLGKSGVGYPTRQPSLPPFRRVTPRHYGKESHLLTYFLLFSRCRMSRWFGRCAAPATESGKKRRERGVELGEHSYFQAPKRLCFNAAPSTVRTTPTVFTAWNRKPSHNKTVPGALVPPSSSTPQQANPPPLPDAVDVHSSRDAFGDEARLLYSDAGTSVCKETRPHNKCRTAVSLRLEQPDAAARRCC